MARRKKSDEKVIHVVFGPGGGRAESDDDKLSQPNSEPGQDRKAASGEPVSDVFTKSEITRLIGLSEAKLRSLDKAGIVTPSARKNGRRVYDFADLIALRTAKALFDQRIRLREVTRAISALKADLPKIKRPLSELRIVSDGRSIVVESAEGSFEPATGQMMLDLSVKTLRDDIVRVLRPSAGRERARAAYELYLEASNLDEDPATLDQAVELYKRALELDPWLAIAYTNLGNIAFRRQSNDEAETFYKRALEIDPRQPEAKYNLGYLMLERGEPESSVEYFRGAIDADPDFADAHFNLAMAYEQMGNPGEARPFWESYIALEPYGTWTDIARRHL
jgi:tetratricopeptide (TPR) repeat protein